MTLPSASKSLASALLLTAAGSLLVSHASADVLLESSVSGGDFANTFSGIGGSNQLDPAVTEVDGGNNNTGSGDSDFYTYTGLTGGQSFTLSITTTPDTTFSPFDNLTFSTLGDVGTDIGDNTFTPSTSNPDSGTITGIVPLTGNLTIEVDQPGEQGGGTYTTTLSVVPEPTSATLAVLGAAALALAARKRQEQNA